ncbi:uncharacterized protein LOC110709892 [Chenopodium quinoa]|uniref:uncharacterized protein LOC110709892 n=1 Tax=Chenopodium quinoa TaxID=63459 RepID=UPI000B76C83F|nr:uncharacterized protein LOC110709892 [Chenopodium quinoa]
MGRSGGLGFWWRDLNVRVVGYSIHHVYGEVLDSGNIAKWRFTRVYGWPEAENKHLTWDLMRSIFALSPLPLLMFGDFNEILGMHEKEGGAVRGERQIDAFREAIDDCECRNLGYKGSVYTWQRGISMETVVCERLDRYLATCEWYSLFPYSEVIHLPLCHSDYAPILLKFGDKADEKKDGKMFRFEASMVIKGRMQAGISKKNIAKPETRLKEVEGKRLDGRRLQMCNEISNELNELRRLEESYWYAQSRANELRDGDKNTKYFHHKASQRRGQNRICGLYDDQGMWQTSKEGTNKVIADYFSGLFASTMSNNFDEALMGVKPKVTDDMNDILDMEPKADEIKDALFQMHPNKATGPDGMHALFFQKFWGTLGHDMVNFVQSWWRGEIDLSKRGGEGNDGTVTLKLDMSKAYDRVEWVFIEKIMTYMGFRIAWIDRIMSTYERASGQKVNLSKTEVAFSKNVNSERKHKIVETLGVREVDRHEKGFDPSYSWRSIWGAKSLLLEGLKWRVGNGSLIKLWDDAWTLGDGAHLVLSPQSNSDLNMRV